MSEMFFIDVHGVAQGPYSYADIHFLIHAGLLGADAPVRDGRGNCLDATAAAMLGTELPPHEPPYDGPNGFSVLRPRTIALLGLIFTPFWTGIMAVFNARRLGHVLPLRAVALILVGWLVGDLVLSYLPIGSYLLQIILYLVATWMMWAHVLAEQQSLADHRGMQFGQAINWIIPAISGIPLAVGAVTIGIIVPWLPTSPVEVCQRALAPTNSNRGAHLSANLKARQAVLDWLLKEAADAHTVGEAYSLARNPQVSPDLRRGCFVDFDLPRIHGSTAQNGKGFFHLLRDGREWRIDEMYFTHVNGQEVELSLLPGLRSEIELAYPVPARVQPALLGRGQFPASQNLVPKEPQNSPYNWLRFIGPGARAVFYFLEEGGWKGVLGFFSFLFLGRSFWRRSDLQTK